MVLRSVKEVDNKVSEREHDKQERLKAIESDFEHEKEYNPFPLPIVSNHAITCKLRIPYP